MGKIVKHDNEYIHLTESLEVELRESLGKIFGGIVAGLAGAKLLHKNDDYFKQTYLKMGDKVRKIEVDPWRNTFESEGEIVMRGDTPWVSIKKGRETGTMVKWTPNWNLIK